MVQVIDAADRSEMITQFEAALNSGAEKTVLKEIRRKLKEKFCPDKYSAQQVDAVCSQVIIQRNKTRKTLEIASLETVPTQSNTLMTTEGTGALGEHYRNETKEKWFAQWMKFITEKTTPEWRAHAKVITLAGPLCLRLPDYIQNGFAAENIVAVEGGSEEEKALFLKNAPEGIRYRLDRLENFIGKEETRFDVVDYDFLGPINDTYLQIIEETPLSNHAFVLVNIMGRRESARSQEILQIALDDYENERSMSARIAAQNKMLQMGRMLTKEDTIRAEQFSQQQFADIMCRREDEELSEARANALTSIFVNGFGAHRSNNPKSMELISVLRKNMEKRLENETINERYVRDEIDWICSGFTNILHQHLSRHGLAFPWKGQLSAAMHIPRRSIWRMPLVESLEKVQYKSEGHGTPYFSVFAELRDPQPVLDLCPTAEKFLLNAVEKTSNAIVRNQIEDGTLPYVLIEHELDRMTSAFRSHNRKKCPIIKNDTIVHRIDGMKLGTIQAGKFLAEIKEYDDVLWKKWPLVDSKHQKEVPWEVTKK